MTHLKQHIKALAIVDVQAPILELDPVQRDGIRRDKSDLQPHERMGQINLCHECMGT